MKFARFLAVFATVALAAGCSTGGSTEPPATGPSQGATSGPSPEDESTQGLTIFGTPASSYPVEDTQSVFPMNDVSALGPREIVIPSHIEGPCQDVVQDHGKVSDSIRLAVETPAAVYCEFDGGNALPASDSAGVTVDGRFTPFTSTAELVQEDGHRQTYAMATDGKRAFWLETVGASATHATWRLFSADLETKKSALVTTAEDALGLVSELPSVPDPKLTVHDGRIVMLSMVPNDQYREKAATDPKSLEVWDSGDFTNALVSLNVDGSAVEISHEGLGTYGYSKAGLVYTNLSLVSLQPAAGNSSDTAGTGAGAATEADTGADADTDASADESGDTETAETHITRTIVHEVNGTAEEIVVDAGNGEGVYEQGHVIENVQISDNYVAFTRGSTLYLLDLTSKTARIIDLDYTLTTQLAGPEGSTSESQVQELALGKETVAILLRTQTEGPASGETAISGAFMTEVLSPPDIETAGQVTGVLHTLDSEPYLLRYEDGHYSFRVGLAEGGVAQYSVAE